MQAFGQYQAGQAAKDEGNTTKKWYNYNASIAEQNAQEAKNAAKTEETQFRKQGDRLLSTQRSLYAKSGVAMTGSPLDVQAETAAEIESDALNIRRNGSLAAQGFKQEAALQRGYGDMAKTRGKNAYSAGLWQAGGSLLSGASGAAQLYGKYNPPKTTVG